MLIGVEMYDQMPEPEPEALVDADTDGGADAPAAAAPSRGRTFAAPLMLLVVKTMHLQLLIAHMPSR